MFFFNRLSIQSKLITMLLAVSITSILATTYIAYSRGQDTLTESAFKQLSSVRASKKNQIQDRIKLIRNQVSHLSEDQMVVSFMKELRESFAKLQDTKIEGIWDEKLKKYYQGEFLPRLKKNIENTPVLESYLPEPPVARYLQYHFIAANPNPPGQKYMLDTAERSEYPNKESEYSTVHKRYHPFFRRFVIDFGYDDLYLIDSQTGELIYTTGKSPAFATNALTGPYAHTNLAEVVKALSNSKDKGGLKIVDFAPYPPECGKPVALIGSPIFDGPRQIGILVLEFPADETNRVMTGNLGWERDGLGKTGEVYLVGADHLMRSKSRPLFENREKYFERLQAAGYSKQEIDKVRRAGTALLSQPVHTRAVESALAGKEDTAITTDYRGIATLTSSSPLDLPGLKWVIVAQMDLDEAFAPLNSLARQILYSSVVIVLVVTVVAVILAHFFVRPIYQLVEGVRRLAAGQTDVVVNLRSRDEFQDLGAAFNQMSQSLKTKTEQLDQQVKDNEELLLNILPGPAAARLRLGEQQVAETFPDVTVLLANLVGLAELEQSMSAEQAVGLFNDLVIAIDEAAERHGIEKVKTIGSSYMAVCGMSVKRLDHAARMIEFALDIVRILHRFDQDQGLNLSVQIAINSGPVVGGIVGRTKFIYDLWGETVNIARSILPGVMPNALVVTERVHGLVQDLYAFDDPVHVTDLHQGKIKVWPVKTAPVSPSRDKKQEEKARA